jgi:hypothetical protein
MTILPFVIDKAKQELKENDNTKKGIVIKTAELLESNGMPLEMICGTISREFHEFASGRYIRDCLADKYKNHAMNRTQSAEATTANDDKNVLDGNRSQTGLGENLRTSQNHIIEDTSSNEAIASEESTSTQSGTSKLHNDTETPADTDRLEEDFQIQIRPEDYTIEDLPKYSSQLKDLIIIYLDKEVRRLRKQAEMHLLMMPILMRGNLAAILANKYHILYRVHQEAGASNLRTCGL